MVSIKKIEVSSSITERMQILNSDLQKINQHFHNKNFFTLLLGICLKSCSLSLSGYVVCF